MKKLISISEIVERLEMDDTIVDVCASADAEYDDVRGLIEVRLGCSAVRGDIRPGPAPPPPEWLPRATVVREAVPLEEASEEARSIFAHWVRQVRHAIPSPVNV